MGYSTDMLNCQKFAQRTPCHMAHTALMSLLSARIQFTRVGEMMEDVRKNGLDSSALFGYKRAGYKYILDNMDSLYAETMSLTEQRDLLDLWSSVPGLGLVKAGFVVQLTRGTIGCIDTHNQKLYDITANELRLPKTLTAKGRMLKIDKYIDTCHKLGGSHHLWKQWCILMAAKYSHVWDSGEAVSRAHVNYLNHYEVYS